MEFRIADTFTDSLARLTGDEQKAVKTTAFDLQLNPANLAMSFHKLDKAKDKNFWSVRVSRDIRLIVHKNDASLLLCYVGHHDDAYDWAERRKLRFGPMPLVGGFDTRDLVGRICAEERGYSWQILNRKIALKELAISGAEFNPNIRERNLRGFVADTLFGNRWLYDQVTKNCADVVISETLPELVARMNALQGDNAVNEATVRASVASYDSEIDRGPALYNDEQLRRIAHLRRWKGDRLRIANFQKIIEPGTGPLMAIRLFIVSRKSLGGIRSDLSARVVDGAGAPIAGLYAIGETAGFGGGGMHGLRALEGTFLGGCIYSARRAARAIGR